MEGQMSFVPKLRLRDIALRRVTVALWNGADVLELCEKLPFEFFPEEKFESEWLTHAGRKVKCNVSRLPLPDAILEEITCFIRPIGSEIETWNRFHEKFVGLSYKDFDLRFMRCLIWTSAGTIDYRKTGRELARFKIVDILKRFKVACLYCVENEISSIWDKLSESHKRFFYTNDLYLPDGLDLEFYWGHVLREEECTLDCLRNRGFTDWSVFSCDAFLHSAVKGNLAAAEHFLEQLASEERGDAVVKATKAVLADHDVDPYGPIKGFPKDRLADVLCYLLSLMTPEQRVAICNEYPFEVLRRFSDWSRHDQLSAISNLVFAASPPGDLFKSYLSFRSLKYPYAKDGCFKLFQNFFPFSSAGFKECFVDHECQFGLMFSDYLYFSADIAKVIFKNVEDTDRRRLASCKSFLRLVDELILEEQWDVIGLCFQEATSTLGERRSLKEAYAQFNREHNSFRFEKNHEKIVSEILDNMDTKPPPERTLSEKKILRSRRMTHRMVYYGITERMSLDEE